MGRPRVAGDRVAEAFKLREGGATQAAAAAAVGISERTLRTAEQAAGFRPPKRERSGVFTLAEARRDAAVMDALEVAAARRGTRPTRPGEWPDFTLADAFERAARAGRVGFDDRDHAVGYLTRALWSVIDDARGRRRRRPRARYHPLGFAGPNAVAIPQPAGERWREVRNLNRETATEYTPAWSRGQ